MKKIIIHTVYNIFVVVFMHDCFYACNESAYMIRTHMLYTDHFSSCRHLGASSWFI